MFRSPSKEAAKEGAAFMEGLRAGLNAPRKPYVPPTPEEAAQRAAQYPPYTITDANAMQVIAILVRYGLTVNVCYTYDDKAKDFVYDVTIRDPKTDRYDGEDANSLSEALAYAFPKFCNDYEGALRREIAAL